MKGHVMFLSVSLAFLFVYVFNGRVEFAFFALFLFAGAFLLWMREDVIRMSRWITNRGWKRKEMMKLLEALQEPLRAADPYLTRFADKFDRLFVVGWRLDPDGKMTMESSTGDEDLLLHPVFHDLQELLRYEGLEIPDILVKIKINHYVHELRYQKLLQAMEHYRRTEKPGKGLEAAVGTYAALHEACLGLNGESYLQPQYLVRYIMSEIPYEEVIEKLGLRKYGERQVYRAVKPVIEKVREEILHEQKILYLKDVLFDVRKPDRPMTLADLDRMGTDGREFEQFLFELFRKIGYECELTPHNDQGVDLIVTHNRRKFAIQAKLYSDKVGNHAVMEVLGGMKYWDCDKGIVITNRDFSDEARKLAQKTGIELWERERLFEIVDKYWNREVEYWRLIEEKPRIPYLEKIFSV